MSSLKGRLATLQRQLKDAPPEQAEPLLRWFVSSLSEAQRVSLLNLTGAAIFRDLTDRDLREFVAVMDDTMHRALIAEGWQPPAGQEQL